MIEFIMDELKSVTEDFYNATGIICVIYDDSKKVVYSYPGHVCPLCSKIRTSKELYEKCIECDLNGMSTVDNTKNPHIYKCHMNLTEAIAPVMEDDAVIGYVMLGGVVCENDYLLVKESVKSVCSKYGFDASELTQMLDSLPKTSSKQINSAVNLMKICGKYLYFNRIMKYKSDNISVTVKKYIEEHFREKISVTDICRDLYISESKLYSVSKAIFSVGASDYIRILKINEAKKLLETTDMSISMVASKVGYDDNNYFIRIFKKMIGCTPAAYRKSNKKTESLQQ